MWPRDRTVIGGAGRMVGQSSGADNVAANRCGDSSNRIDDLMKAGRCSGSIL